MQRSFFSLVPALRPLTALGLVLVLSAGCAGAPADTAPPPPLQASGTAEALSPEEDSAPSVPDVLWTVAISGQTAALREGAEPETWELWLEGEAPVLLKTLSGDDGPIITGRPFTDILGWDGLALRQSWSEEGFRGTSYYALEENSLRPIAHSFGFYEEDYPVDLDGDGITELVAINTYGGDGYREVNVFRRRGDGAEMGRLQNWPELPDHDDWGVNSTAQGFDPERKVFQIHYDLKDTHPSEEPGLVETAGLEWFVFETFAEETADE